MTDSVWDLAVQSVQAAVVGDVEHEPVIRVTGNRAPFPLVRVLADADREQVEALPSCVIGFGRRRSRLSGISVGDDDNHLGDVTPKMAARSDETNGFVCVGVSGQIRDGVLVDGVDQRPLVRVLVQAERLLVVVAVHQAAHAGRVVGDVKPIDHFPEESPMSLEVVHVDAAGRVEDKEDVGYFLAALR